MTGCVFPRLLLRRPHTVPSVRHRSGRGRVDGSTRYRGPPAVAGAGAVRERILGTANTAACSDIAEQADLRTNQSLRRTSGRSSRTPRWSRSRTPRHPSAQPRWRGSRRSGFRCEFIDQSRPGSSPAAASAIHRRSERVFHMCLLRLPTPAGQPGWGRGRARPLPVEIASFDRNVCQSRGHPTQVHAGVIVLVAGLWMGMSARSRRRWRGVSRPSWRSRSNDCSPRLPRTVSAVSALNVSKYRGASAPLPPHSVSMRSAAPMNSAASWGSFVIDSAARSQQIGGPDRGCAVAVEIPGHRLPRGRGIIERK